MKVNIVAPETSLSMELSEDMDIGTVGILVAAEIGAEATQLSFRGATLTNAGKTVKDYGVRSGDTLYAGSPPADPERQRVEGLMRELRENPYQISMLKQNNPPLAEALEKNDIDTFAQIILEQETHRRDREFRQSQLHAILAQDPFNIEAQRELEESIRDENVEQLRQQALEHMPESFAEGSIVMLYIDVVVNGHKLKAFVDSGAQMTIMSSSCAERVGIMRLVDRRFEGMAVGVGTQRIIGRVHMYQLQIGEDHLPTSFSILENQPMDMLLGLDMLKRHRCIIDLQENCLRIGTTGHSTRFLPESEIPKRERLNPSPDRAASDGAAAAAAPKFDEALVERLAKLASSMGLPDFPPARVIEALTVCDGDIDGAAAYLLEQGGS